VKSPEVEKSSSGRVTSVAKSSSDNVSEGASEEQLADNEVLSFDEALPEEEEGSYEADEKPERGRPRRQIQTPRKFSDFVVNSAKNRQIRTTKELAEELAAEYSLMPEERRKCLHQLRGKRVAQRHLCSGIRKAFPMTRGTEEHEAFLCWLQKTM